MMPRSGLQLVLIAVCERDPACNSPLEALLFYKGFHAIQAYRFAHALLHQERRSLALYLQGRMALVFGIDINPAARLGRGIMIDHGTGVVIGGAPGFEPGNGGIKIRKRPLICKGFPVSCCICLALDKECARCRPNPRGLETFHQVAAVSLTRAGPFSASGPFPALEADAG
jgi:hypothetical protein